MKAYTDQKQASIESLIDSEKKDIELLKNNEGDIDKKMQALYKDFPEEWEKRQKKMAELDEHIKGQNNVEIVRHIKEHLLKKLNLKKTEHENYLKTLKEKLSKCYDDLCKEKLNKIIAWVEKTISNVNKVIEFYEKRMEQYMNKEDIKLMEGAHDPSDEDEDMREEMENQGQFINGENFPEENPSSKNDDTSEELAPSGTNDLESELESESEELMIPAYTN